MAGSFDEKFSMFRSLGSEGGDSADRSVDTNGVGVGLGSFAASTGAVCPSTFVRGLYKVGMGAYGLKLNGSNGS